MFFILSKILAFLLRPIIWAVGLLLLSLFARQTPWRKRYIYLALSIFLVFGNRALFNSVVKWWEVPPSSLNTQYDAAIVLGGYLQQAGLLAPAPPEFSERADRLLHALGLWQEGKVNYIVLSGGAGNLWFNEVPEAQTAAAFAQSLGIPDSVLLLEDQSRNTAENARHTASLLQQHEAIQTTLLITSAWHMRRAQACFGKAGISPTPYPVDFYQSRTPLAPSEWLLPQSAVLRDWEAILKEWVGFLVYRLKKHL